MRSRSFRALTAVGLTGLLFLGGCGDSPTKSAPKASSVLDQTTITGGSETEAPKVTLKPAPLTVTETTTKVITPGTGAAVAADAIVSVRFVMLNGKDGTQLSTNFGQATAGLALGDAGLLPGLKKGLTNQKVGSRVLVAMPPADAFGAQGNADLKLGATDTLVMLMDVVSAGKALAAPEGAAVKPAAGLPGVTVVNGKPATFTVSKQPAPKATVVQPLIKGTGKAVAKGQTIRVVYTGALYKDGKVFDSSAKQAPGYTSFPIGVGGVIKGWDTGLVGQPVGSRVLLVIPAAEAYGAQGQPPTIGPNEPLMFVIDILAAY